MRTLYNAALLPMRAASIVFGAWPRKSPEATLERDQRMARRLPASAAGAVWIHGASVGEARIVKSLAAELSRRGGPPLSVSSMTSTGRSQLPAPPEVAGAFFVPLDLPAVQRRAFDVLKPSMLVLVETELWPNLMTEAYARGIPVVIVNGRLAPERAKRYRLFSALYRPLLSEIDAIGVASADELARFASLGAPERALTVTGNVKFDLPPPPASPAELQARFGLDPTRPMVAAGSTGPGEDRHVLNAFALARQAVPSLALLLAPRHPERFAAAEAEARRRGLTVTRVSSGAAAGAADVLLVDTVGELASLYVLASSAFVGGSLVRVGGHNLLEPIAAGVPVLFGPYVEHVADTAALLLDSGCAQQVDHSKALGFAWAHLARDRAERARRAELGREVLAVHRGALRRSADLVLAVWERARASRIA